MLRKLLAGAAALALTASAALAATTPNSFVTPQTPNRGFVALTSASGLNSFQTLYTAGVNGSRCYSITATSTDTVGHNVTLQLLQAGNVMFQETVAVGIAAGQPPVAGGGPVVPLLTPSVTTGLPVDQYGNQYLQLISGDTIKVADSYAAISSGEIVNIYAICSDY